ncbi:hypothetical protein SEA_TYPHA_107 [Mycobacterium phage Typha]|uniref:DUF732 domain-containing protein n=1 Tax=Mycobacterium phage Typha TaxID=2517971 RepID=A0A482JDS5_9CAUD|nr:hypothetical protein KCH40_gp062 [Mycobacterium phage Typha]QBP29762.1 hypothetical protein SEA_TYPHA_107 [Mycobacterium phage Typha]URM86549.1 hypothetical protein PBI_HILLTOPFARM_111 [Mycobacterium phage Hilltopfarm]
MTWGITVAALVTALVGCSAAGQTPQAATTATTTVTTTMARGAISDQDRVFLSQLQSDQEVWEREFSFVPRDVLIQAGERTCTAMKRSKTGALQEGLDVGLHVEAVAALMHAAATAYCPDQLTGVQ